MIIGLGLLAWWLSGFVALVREWTDDYDLKVGDVFAFTAFAILGPIWWIFFTVLRVANVPPSWDGVVIKKRK